MKANRYAKIVKDENGYSNLMPIALGIVIGFAILFIGAFVNGEIRDSLTDSYPAANKRSKTQNQSVLAQANISDNFDSSIDIVQIVIIITLLASAIGAIFLFTRFR